MYEASQQLTREFVIRALLDSYDRRSFLALVEPYRDGKSVDLARLEQDGLMESYNLLAYLTTSSTLKKTVLESLIANYSDDSSKKELLNQQSTKLVERLKKLQQKTVLGTEIGGFVDELQMNGEGGGHQSAMVVNDTVLDTSNKTVEEQIAIYQNGVEKVLMDQMGKGDETLKRQGLKTICTILQEREPIIVETVEQEVKANNMAKEQRETVPRTSTIQQPEAVYQKKYD